MPARTETPRNVRVSATAHADLKRMADADGVTLREKIDALISEAKRERFFEQMNARYEEMSDAERTSYDEEMRSLEGTLADGLEEGRSRVSVSTWAPSPPS